MAVSLMQADSNVSHGVNQYTADTKEDVKKLPINCKPGSAAICLEDGSVYMMNSKHEWKEI